MASGTTLDDLMYVGMVGIIDPERPQVEQAVAQLKSGGVIVKMITGDAEKTAKAIGKERFPSHVFDTISSSVFEYDDVTLAPFHLRICSI